MVKPEEPLVPSRVPLQTSRFGEATTCLLCPTKARQGGQPRLPASPRSSRSPKPCSGAAGSLVEVTRMSSVYLVPADNSSKPLTGARVLQSQGYVLSRLPSPTPGSAGDVHHVPVDSSLSAGTWWSSFRSKMNSPRSCLWSPQ